MIHRNQNYLADSGWAYTRKIDVYQAAHMNQISFMISFSLASALIHSMGAIF